jgi:hypothetical protein
MLRTFSKYFFTQKELLERAVYEINHIFRFRRVLFSGNFRSVFLDKKYPDNFGYGSSS